jgi:hypothetical protein
LCTLSWVHDPAGYELFFNRDERLERGPELPASALETNGVRWIAPRDGDFGGAWVAVNELGLTLAVLNAYAESLGTPPDVWTSRGRLVTELIDAANGAEATRRLPGLGLRGFRPFVLVTLEPAAPVRVARWDGRSLALRENAEDELPLVSSGVVLEAARRHRAEVLARLAPNGIDGATLERFHRSHEGGPSALSVCMHRDDARTRSTCRVTVSADEVRLVHTPGPPCETAPLPAVALARRQALAR